MVEALEKIVSNIQPRMEKQVLIDSNLYSKNERFTYFIEQIFHDWLNMCGYKKI